MEIKGKFRIALLHCPYDQWLDPLSQELFQKSVQLKLSGYLKEYPYGVLPVDATDFIGVQHMICQETADGQLTPLSGFKTITLEKCSTHGQSFPGLGLVRAAGAKAHEQAMLDIVERCEKMRIPLAYMGSWTIHPGIRQDRDLCRELKSIVEAMYVHYHQDAGIPEMVIGGTLRFKTERLFSSWGHRPLEWQGKVLPPIHVKHLLNEAVTVMHLKEFTPLVKTRAQKWKELWRERLEVGVAGWASTKKAA